MFTLFLACHDPSPRRDDRAGAPAELQHAPETVSFGSVALGDTVTQALVLTNIGGGTTEVTSASIDDPLFTLTRFVPGDLAGGDSQTITVDFTGTGADESATLTIESDLGQILVPVTALAPDPVLYATPASLDFGWVLPDATSTPEVVRLLNIGTADLTIDAVSSSDPAFLTDLEVPLVLGPQEEAMFHVTFAPTDAADHTGVVTVSSNDPDGPNETTVTGSSRTDTPFALCDADPTVVRPGDTATFLGGESWDPRGEPLAAYTWTLTDAPFGSAATLEGTGTDRELIADAEGPYEATLVVTNSDGTDSAPCVATFEASLEDDLAITLTWTHAGDDMDLHLVRPGGELHSNGDCYYANCTYGALDWGNSGDEADDPLMEFDDVSGTGPELITLEEPEDGAFTIYVEDYAGSVWNGDNDTTVTIQLGGVEVASRTLNVDDEGADVAFYTISYPDLTITEL